MTSKWVASNNTSIKKKKEEEEEEKKENTSVLFYSSGDQKLEISLTGLKSRWQLGCVPSGSSGESSFSCFFRYLEAACTPWLMTPSSIFKASSTASSRLTCSLPPFLLPSLLSFCHHVSFSVSDPPASLLQGPLGLHWAHRIIQGNLISKIHNLT